MYRSPYRLLIVVFIAINGLFIQSLYSQKQLDSLFAETAFQLNLSKECKAQNALNQIQELYPELSVKDALRVIYYQAAINIGDDMDDLALEGLLTGFTKLKKLKTSKYHHLYAEEIGRIYGRANDFKLAIDFFKQGLSFATEQNDSLAISSAYLNIGSIYQMKQEMGIAEVNYEKVLRFFPTEGGDTETLATVYSNLIGIALGKGEFDLAQDYGIKSLEIHTQNKDTLKLAGVLSNLGSISMYLKELDKSNDYYFKAYELLKDRTDTKSREITALTLDNISQVYYLKESYKNGYDYLFEGTSIERELSKEKLENKISEIGAKYALEEKEKQTEIERSKKESRELLLYILGIALAGTLVSIFLFIRATKLKRAKTKLEFEREKIEQAHEIEKMQNDVQMKILNATLDGREAERRHISEILHDTVSSLLSSANLHVVAVKMQLKDQSPSEVEKIQAIISETSDKVRDLSHKLISSVLLKFGLRTAIEDLCEKYSNSRLTFKFEVKDVGRYDEHFEVKTHHIIEELANNIMKHSNAYNASIRMRVVKNKLNIEIFDDGDGFNLQEVTKKDGLGLTQVKARVKVMNGKIEIKPFENTGTQIYIDLPIPN
ncbi:tetratricopeptide repeat-containing sensor histidine kinase [Urechidicola vernalis]|uniref:histidine kinase n=1 Tax=Urechidicola vernalis TaxID=3075600 RepID=A0ABU2Y440_9FLAO|nr:ATP-binding protein [Urechidicola sp. P050]MDT0552807.1 ATP-binding protein [Urechidicola sp. P050]